MSELSLCDDIIAIAGAAIFGMWAHIVWLQRATSKRLDLIARAWPELEKKEKTP